MIDPRNKLPYAQIRKVIVTAINAHKIMLNTEYDKGFQYGMEHVLYLIDSLANEHWQNEVKKLTRSKRYDI